MTACALHARTAPRQHYILIIHHKVTLAFCTNLIISYIQTLLPLKNMMAQWLGYNF